MISLPYVVEYATVVLSRKDYFVACAGSKESDACTKVSAIVLFFAFYTAFGRI